MNPKDFVYNNTFKDLMSKGLNQKQAGDLASRAVSLWTRGRTFDEAVKQVSGEAKQLLKTTNVQLKIF